MGMIFKVPGILIFVLGGLWGTFICLKIVIDALGFIGGLIAFFALPITLVFAPFYVGLKYDNWFPLILIYGTGMIGTILFAIGSKVSGDKWVPV